MDPHLDAERLAAFMEGSISAGERAQIERHAADCPHCMQQLAVMARTAPVASARASALAQFMRWAVPAAVAATALAVWINVEEGRREQPTPAASERAAPAISQPKDAPARDATADAYGTPAPAVRPRVAVPQTARPGVARSEARADLAKSAEAPVAPPPLSEPPAAIAGSADANRDTTGLAAGAAAATPAPAAPIDTRQPLAETVQTERRESLTRPLAYAAGARFEIPSPDPDRRWRVQGRVLERTGDGGRTWQAQGPALSVDVFAGSAPSVGVAWLVGRAGAVLRTTDGEQWARVPFPDTADLTAVRAVSALEAEVSTADGRRFRTADGGLTWVPQESPAPPF